jgi:hypothetical protein
MKNLVLSFFLLILCIIQGYSQSLKLADDFGPLTNGADVVQSGPSDTLQLITWLNLTNNTASTMRVMMKKQEISMLPETSSSICWAGYCYGPEMMVCIEPLIMQPGELVSGCFGHFGPHGSRGVSIIRWTFYNQANPSDSLSVTVRYSTYPTGINHIQSQPYSLASAGPVPADNTIKLKYMLPPAEKGRIELRNNTGKLVATHEDILLSGISSFNSQNLPSGVYFCTLVVDGKPCLTRKIPVYHGLLH